MSLHLDTGKVIAYVGGLVVSASSMAQKVEHAAAQAGAAAGDVLLQAEQLSTQTVPLLQAAVMPAIEVTVGDLTTLGGFAVIVSRFAWDIWRDRRDRKQARSRTHRRGKP